MRNKWENIRKNDLSFEFSILIVFILTTIANVLGVVFQSLSGHLLNDPQLYAELNAVMALFNILVLPTVVASCFVSKHTAQLHAKHEYGKIKDIIFITGKALALFTFLFVTIMLTIYRKIGIWLHIEDTIIIILAIILSAITLFSAVFTGALQGSKAFVLYGIWGLLCPAYKILAIVSSMFFSRKLVAILLVWIGGALFSYIVGVLFLKKILGQYKREKVILEKKNTTRYIIKLLITNAGMVILSNIDMLIVKHSFDREAGQYSAARMIGYGITYLASAFVVVLFPTVAEGTKDESEKLRLFKKTLIYDIILSISATVGLIIFFDIGIKILLGSEYLQCKQYLIPVIIYVLPVSLMNLIVNYGMAKDSMIFIACSLFVSCGLAVACSIMLRESLMTFLLCLGFFMWVVVLCNIIYIFGKGSSKILSKGQKIKGK